MNDPLNHYFSHQLFFCSTINLKKFEKIKNNPEKRSWVLYANEDFQKRSVYFKEQLTKRRDDVAEIRQALINYLTQQYASFRAVDHTTVKKSHVDSEASILDQIICIYWAAVICACTRGKVIALQPVSPLNKITNTLLRRIIVLILNRLKKERFTTQLDVVEFLTTYITFDDRFRQRWAKLLRRATLPVWRR